MLYGDLSSRFICISILWLKGKVQVLFISGSKITKFFMVSYSSTEFPVEKNQLHKLIFLSLTFPPLFRVYVLFILYL